MKYINDFNISRRENNLDNNNLRTCNRQIKKELTFVLKETFPVDVVM